MMKPALDRFLAWLAEEESPEEQREHEERQRFSLRLWIALVYHDGYVEPRWHRP